MNKTRFPWKYVVLNSIVLLFLLTIYGVARAPTIENQSFADRLASMAFIAVFLLPGSLVLILGSLLYQGLVYKIFGGFVTKSSLWAPIFLVPAVFIAVVQTYSLLPSNSIKTVLAAGRLSELPSEATEVKVYSWTGVFTGAHYLKFKAPPESVENFLNQSPSLSGIKPKVFSSDYMRIPYPEDFREKYYESGKCDFFNKDKSAPPWFAEEIRDSGRLFEIPDVDGRNWGYVIVDDVENLVYIKVILS